MCYVFFKQIRMRRSLSDFLCAAATTSVFLDYVVSLPNDQCRAVISDATSVVTNAATATAFLTTYNGTVLRTMGDAHVIMESLAMARRYRLRSVSLLDTAAKCVTPPTPKLLTTLAVLGYDDPTYWGETVPRALMESADGMTPAELLSVLEAFLALGYMSDVLFLHIEDVCLRKVGKGDPMAPAPSTDSALILSALRTYVRS